MKRNSLHRLAGGAVVALAISVVLAAEIPDTEFSAFYQVNEVQAEPNLVSLTLSIRVFNRNDLELADATASLRNLSRTEEYASFPGLSIPSNGSVLVSAVVTVPLNEFEAWMRGVSPALDISYVDPEGVLVEYFVQMLPYDFGEDN